MPRNVARLQRARLSGGCGDAQRVLLACRAAKVPIFFTRYVVGPVNDDVGMFHSKIGVGVGRGENLYWGGMHGAEIVEDLPPLATEGTAATDLWPIPVSCSSKRGLPLRFRRQQ